MTDDSIPDTIDKLSDSMEGERPRMSQIKKDDPSPWEVLGGVACFILISVIVSAIAVACVSGCAGHGKQELRYSSEHVDDFGLHERVVRLENQRAEIPVSAQLELEQQPKTFSYRVVFTLTITKETKHGKAQDAKPRKASQVR